MTMFTFDTIDTSPHAAPQAARTGVFHLPHGPLRTPIFMPVATQAALKGITVEQLEELDVEIILGNTYHLGLRPGEEILRELTRLKDASLARSATRVHPDGNEVGCHDGVDRASTSTVMVTEKPVMDNMDGIHFLEGWKRNILTDSGGFQMVSLLKLAHIDEEGVRFQSTHGGSGIHTSEDTDEMRDSTSGSISNATLSASTTAELAATTTTTASLRSHEASPGDEVPAALARNVNITDAAQSSSYSLLLRPEDSIRIQNAIGGDIMMQLDDVVHTLTVGPRVRESALRSIRWLDRCLVANANPTRQCIFGIVQGALDHELRRYCVNEIVKREDCKGYAIGGLSGGEAKSDFWRVVRLCTQVLPSNKPRYCMGVGYPEDILVCIALGVDMFDCVFACRTARFGSAMTSRGKLQLTRRQFAEDYRPLDESCTCMTCRTYTRAYLHLIAGKDSLGATVLSYHNIAFLINLTRGAGTAMREGAFTEYVQNFFMNYYATKDYPEWCVDALRSVGIELIYGDDNGVASSA